jgi:molybdate transport system substrate-binding protein
MSNIRVLCAGAPKGGVMASAEVFEAETGHTFEISFSTAPEIKKRIESGTAEVDVVVVPVGAMSEFEANGTVVAGASAVIGSIRAGVVVRKGAPEPDISSADTLRAALLGTDAIVRNEASSGLYIAKMIENLGIAEQVADKVICLPTGGDVLRHLGESTAENEIGFGQVTEIRRIEDEVGVTLVGALPKEVENITTYAAAPLSAATDVAAASAFVQFMVSDKARGLFTATGVE